MITARFDYARDVALSLLDKHLFKSLPIHPEKIIDKINNVDLFSFSYMAQRGNLSVLELSKTLGTSTGCCMYNTNLRKYAIFYNDMMQSVGRIRWTIAHEFGHYALHHLEDFSADNLTEEEYRILEQEADAFARELLAPTALVLYTGISMPNFCPHILAECFGVSVEAADNITEFNYRHYVLPKIHPPGEYLIQRFKPYLNTLHKRYPTARELADMREIEKALRVQGRSNRYIRQVLKDYGY